jgi:hypothetical protein
MILMDLRELICKDGRQPELGHGCVQMQALVLPS